MSKSSDHVIRISGDDWRAAIDGMRVVPSRRTWDTITQEQRDVIEYARSGENPVPWSRLGPAFKARFGWGNEKSLSEIWRERGCE